MENVSVVVESKDDTYGVTRGTFVAEADTYGADKFWVVLKPIPIDLELSSDDEALVMNEAGQIQGRVGQEDAASSQ